LARRQLKTGQEGGAGGKEAAKTHADSSPDSSIHNLRSTNTALDDRGS
jgi:hypothetical protein